MKKKDFIPKFEFEDIILVFIAFLAIFVIISHYFGFIEDLASISLILIILCLLVIHIVLNNSKQNKKIDKIEILSEAIKKINEKTSLTVEINNKQSDESINISKDIQKRIKKQNDAYEIGFRQIHLRRADFIKKTLLNKIESSCKFTKIIAICLTELRQERGLTINYIELLQNKIIEHPKYFFEFFLLDPKKYVERAEIEDSSEKILKQYRHTSLLNLLWIKSQIFNTTNNIEDVKRINIYEYSIMPPVSQFLIDNTIYYGPYIAMQCGDIPIVEIEKTDSESSIYELFDDHYNRIRHFSTPFKIDEVEFDSILSEKDGCILKSINTKLNNNLDYYYNLIDNEDKSFEDIFELLCK